MDWLLSFSLFCFIILIIRRTEAKCKENWTEADCKKYCKKRSK